MELKYVANGKPRCTYVLSEKGASNSARSSPAGGVITGHVCIYGDAEPAHATLRPVYEQAQLLLLPLLLLLGEGRGGPPSLLTRYLT